MPQCKTQNRMDAARRRSQRPAQVCLSCFRPRSDRSTSGLCHRCCRKPDDPSPETIEAMAKRLRVEALLKKIVEQE